MIYALLLGGAFAAALWNSEIHSVRIISRTVVVAVVLLAPFNGGAW